MDFDSTSEKFLQNKRAVNYLKFKQSGRSCSISRAHQPIYSLLFTTTKAKVWIDPTLISVSYYTKPNLLTVIPT